MRCPDDPAIAEGFHQHAKREASEALASGVPAITPEARHLLQTRRAWHDAECYLGECTCGSSLMFGRDVYLKAA